jgi:hypothetical protein
MDRLVRSKSPLRFIGTIGATIVAVVALAAPAAHASPDVVASKVDSPITIAEDAPTGKRCGAYHEFVYLRYLHCGSGWILLEVERRFEPNTQRCIGPWQDNEIDLFLYAYNAHSIGPCPA